VLRLVALYPAIDQEVGEGAPDLGPWLLLRRSDDAVIGTISCARTGNPAEVSVGYDITPPCWGEGYATEALGAVVEHLLACWTYPGCAPRRPHIAARRAMRELSIRGSWRCGR